MTVISRVFYLELARFGLAKCKCYKPTDNFWCRKVDSVCTTCQPPDSFSRLFLLSWDAHFMQNRHYKWNVQHTSSRAVQVNRLDGCAIWHLAAQLWHVGLSLPSYSKLQLSLLHSCNSNILWLMTTLTSLHVAHKLFLCTMKKKVKHFLSGSINVALFPLICLSVSLKVTRCRNVWNRGQK